VQYDKPVCGALASRLSSLDAAEKHAAWLSFRSGLSDRRENVGAEDGEELSNAGQKYFHVLTVRFGKFRATCLILFKGKSTDLSGLGNEAALEIPHM
jgi:hypothetical protein